MSLSIDEKHINFSGVIVYLTCIQSISYHFHMFQASFHDDIPCEIHSKIHLVDLAGRFVICVAAVHMVAYVGKYKFEIII